MNEIIFPEFEEIIPFKIYGNEYISFTLIGYNTKAGYYFDACVCDICEPFVYNEQGLEDMKEWINEKRKEVGQALGLFTETPLNLT